MLSSLNVGKTVLKHAVTKGDKTELDWIKWLESYLPKRYRIAKGVVIDSNGKESDQIDAIIYDPQYSYLVLHHKETQLIPAESVYAVFEVKQTLNKSNIEYAGTKAKSVRELLVLSSARVKASLVIHFY